MKPTVRRWVSASAPGCQRDNSKSPPSQSSSKPASAASKGAVMKKRKGAVTGGAFSNDNSACIKSVPAQRVIKISKVPSGSRLAGRPFWRSTL
jgi:hypothetical protein